MPKFTRDAPAPLSVATPSSVPDISNPLTSLLGVAEGAAQADRQGKAGADTATRLLGVSNTMDAIRTDTLSGQLSPEVSAVVAAQSSVDVAASQLSGRVSDTVKIRQSIAAKQAYQQALMSGNMEAATKILELTSRITGTAPGMATQEVVEREEIRQEKIQEKVKEISIQKLNEYGQGHLVHKYGSSDTKDQQEVAQALANIDTMIVNNKNNAAKLQEIDVQASTLRLSNAQQEEINKRQLLPSAEAYLGSARDLVTMAISESEARPLTDADPELISAQVARVKFQFDDVINSVTRMRRPGIEANVDAIITQVRGMQQHAMDAATNKEAAAAYKSVYESVKNKAYLDLPAGVKKSLEYLPLASAIQREASYGRMSDKARNSATDWFENMSTVLGSGVTPSLATTGASPKDQQDMFKVLNSVVATNLDKLGLPENQKTVDGMIAYLVGASNDYQQVELKQRVAYGDFVSGILSSRAFEGIRI